MPTATTIHKAGYLRLAGARAPGVYDFTLSTPAKDSYGDIVKGPWNLDRFQKNPIALWMHDTKTPIGTWENLRMSGENLVGSLRLASRDTSAFIDQIWSLLEQGILKAVSVGFRAGEVEPIDAKDPWAGAILSQNELVECSLVSIPANHEALRRHIGAASLDLRTRAALTPKSGVCLDGRACEQLQASAQASATPPETETNRTIPMTLADRIKAKQTELNALSDQIAETAASIDGAGALSDEQQKQLEALTESMEKAQSDLATYTRTEQALARKAGNTAPPATAATAATGDTPRIHLVNNKPKGHRAISTIATIVKANGLRADPIQIAREYYKDQSEVELLVRAATAPATTDGATWATNLVRETWGEFQELLRGVSVYPQIPGMRVDFGNTLNLPVQNGRGALAGGFVAENGAIPVKEGSIGTITMTPKKLAVISAYSKELARRSMPSIESIIQQQILADTAEVLDTTFFADGARTTTAPAGLQNAAETGAANINPVTGATVAHILTDTAALLERVYAIKAMSGVWLMNPAERLALEDKQDAVTGHFVFRDAVNGAHFRGYPIIESTNVTAGVVAFIANNAMGFGSELMPSFEMSDSATLHTENAAPASIVTGAGVAAAPVISLFQQDLFAIKMVMSLDWRILRAAGVQVLTGANAW